MLPIQPQTELCVPASGLIISNDKRLLARMEGQANDIKVNRLRNRKSLISLKSFLADIQTAQIIYLDINSDFTIEMIKIISKSSCKICLVMLSDGSSPLIHALKVFSESLGIKATTAISKQLPPQTIFQLASLFQKRCFQDLDYINSSSIDWDAITNQVEHIQLFLQPKISLLDSSIVGCEALSRISCNIADDSFIFLYPDDFIPEFARRGRLEELSIANIKNSFETAARLRNKKILTNISVNIFDSDLSNEGIIDYIEKQALLYKIPAKYFTFEITEFDTSTTNSGCIENAIRLRSKGFRLAIDDFGTGLSSLRRLYDYPVDEIKIDKYFVDKSSLDSSAIDIIRHCVELSRSLNINIVAEGVETELQKKILVDSGCDYAQGYLWSPALPVNLYENWHIRRMFGY